MIVRQRFPHSTIDRNLDRAFEQLTNSFFDQRRHVGPTVDASWDGDEYVLTVDLPGVPAEAISIDVAGDLVTISASTDQSGWHRNLRLGDRLDPDKINARHVDGRLTVRVGTVDQPESRRVEIDTTPTPAAIETASTDQTSDQSNDTNSTE